MESLLEKSENEYNLLQKKYSQLLNSLKGLDAERRVKALVKIDDLRFKVDRMELIYLGKRMEQAGRDLAKAADSISNSPGDVEDVIEITNNTPKTEKSLNLSFEVADTYKKIIRDKIQYALDEIEDTYNEIFPEDPEDDDDDNDEDDED